MNRLFPISIAIALTALACDPQAEWLDSDSVQEVEEQAVPTLVDKAVPAAKPPAKEAPAAEVAAKAKPAETKVNTARVSSGDDEPAAEPEVDVDADLYLKRLVVATGVEGREPVGAATSFTAGAQDRIYAFVEIGNRDAADSAVSVAFVKDGKPVKSGVELRVGASPRWRTWAFTRLAKEPGEWHVVVLGPKGQELGRTSFTVTAAGAQPQAKADGTKEPKPQAKADETTEPTADAKADGPAEPKPRAKADEDASAG